MPKVLFNALTPPRIKSAPPGRHGDGGGLFLLVKPTGKRSWVFRYKKDGKTRDMGLGAAIGAGAVTLAEARDKASKLKRLTREGIDPLDAKVNDKQRKAADGQAERIRAITFKQVAEAYMAAHESSWRNPKHRAQWRSTLETYAYPHMGELSVADVATSHVMAALQPIWNEKPETASRVRGRIECILDYARAREWRSGENPARWRGHVANMLPARDRVSKVAHHAALQWREIGAFMTKLRGRDALAARALELAILTAARTSEVLGARWTELDTTLKVWTIPAERMKAGREHRIPLSQATLDLLELLKPLRYDDNDDRSMMLFPGNRKNRPLSQMAMLMLLRRMERPDLTVHGFRSTFRDWCAETTAYPHELAEIALAHTVADKVEAAYRRGDMMDKRRRMMDDWAEYCGKCESVAADVIPLRSQS